jgi:hypothetical protein
MADKIHPNNFYDKNGKLKTIYNKDEIPIDMKKFDEWVDKNVWSGFLRNTTETVKIGNETRDFYLNMTSVGNQFKAAIEQAEAMGKIPDENGKINSNLIDKQSFYDWVNTTFGNTDKSNDLQILKDTKITRYGYFNNEERPLNEFPIEIQYIVMIDKAKKKNELVGGGAKRSDQKRNKKSRKQKRRRVRKSRRHRRR